MGPETNEEVSKLWFTHATLSPGLMVARVVSKHVVKLHIVDFVGCSGLETLQDDGELLFRHLHAEVVKD